MPNQRKFDFNFTDEVTSEVRANVQSLFRFEPWQPSQIAKGDRVREKLAEAYLAVLENVPPSPARTRALNMITDVRMLANAAITFKGEF